MKKRTCHGLDSEQTYLKRDKNFGCSKLIFLSQIQVNGQPRDLPYITDKVSIIRLGERVVFESQSGVNVLSDFKSNYHFIALSGWYYGKVAGLLGRYDNEPSNDLMTPEGDVIDNLKKFMNSWEVDNSCKSKNVYTDDEGRKNNKKCSAVFEKTSSSLRPCFLMVSFNLS